MLYTVMPPYTAEQFAAAQTTTALSLWDWSRLTSQVRLAWGQPDANVHDDFEVYAHTWVLDDYGGTPTVDRAGRPDWAEVVVRDDLIQFFEDGNGPPNPRWPNRRINGVYDVIHHELGHVLASKLSAEQIHTIGQCFGRDITDWQDDRSLPWNQRVLESFCETFKDIFLGDQRMWDNRAIPLPRQNFEMFLNVLREICPASDIPDGQWICGVG